MLKDEPLLLGVCLVQQLPDILPRLDELPGLRADLVQRVLPLAHFLKLLVQPSLLLLQAGQLFLHAFESGCPERLEHTDQLADVPTDLRELPPQDFFLAPYPRGLLGDDLQRFLHDPFPCFLHRGQDANPFQDGDLQCLGREPGGLARHLAAFVDLPGADVVVVLPAVAVSPGRRHLGTATAPDQPPQEIAAVAVTPVIAAVLGRLSQHSLNSLELLLADERLVAVVLERFAPLDAADVQGAPQDGDDLLLGEQLAAPHLAGPGGPDRTAEAELVEFPLHRSRRAEFLERIEELPTDDVGPLGIDEQLAGLCRIGLVPDDATAIPEPSLDTILHDVEGPLGGHLPFQLREDDNHPEHGPAARGRSVELLPQADDIHPATLEQLPQFHEICQAAGDPVQLHADHDVDLASLDVPLEPK